MRFVAPARGTIDPALFRRPPLSQWHEFGVLDTAAWPTLAALNELAKNSPIGAATRMPRFVAQTSGLIGDGLHYEQRIAERGQIATREHNWHDLLNALVWLRFPALKAALNARQVGEIVQVGTKQRSRAQCALTHFDEAGVIVLLRDPDLLGLWDAHDWHGLFWSERSAWHDGRIQVLVFGHALLEHAFAAGSVAGRKGHRPGHRRTKCKSGRCRSTISRRRNSAWQVAERSAGTASAAVVGHSAWHADNAAEIFYQAAPCFRPLRRGTQLPSVPRLEFAHSLSAAS